MGIYSDDGVLSRMLEFDAASTDRLGFVFVSCVADTKYYWIWGMSGCIAFWCSVLSVMLRSESVELITAACFGIVMSVLDSS